MVLRAVCLGVLLVLVCADALPAAKKKTKRQTMSAGPAFPSSGATNLFPAGPDVLPPLTPVTSSPVDPFPIIPPRSDLCMRHCAYYQYCFDDEYTLSNGSPSRVLFCSFNLARLCELADCQSGHVCVIDDNGLPDCRPDPMATDPCRTMMCTADSTCVNHGTWASCEPINMPNDCSTMRCDFGMICNMSMGYPLCECPPGLILMDGSMGPAMGIGIGMGMPYCDYPGNMNSSDPCSTMMCDFGMICHMDRGGGAYCDCPTGMTLMDGSMSMGPGMGIGMGMPPYCDYPGNMNSSDPCSTMMCDFGMICHMDRGGGAYCDCPTGMTLMDSTMGMGPGMGMGVPYCGVPQDMNFTDSCSTITCGPGMVCITDRGGPYCDCPPGLTMMPDMSCMMMNNTFPCQDVCQGNPCINGGICEEVGCMPQCSCPMGFVGMFCEYPDSTIMDPCNGLMCDNGFCVPDITGQASCVCHDGSVTNCALIACDSCMMNPCMNGGTCQEANNGTCAAVCYCPMGFFGDFCEIPEMSLNSSSMGPGPVAGGSAFGGADFLPPGPPRGLRPNEVRHVRWPRSGRYDNNQNLEWIFTAPTELQDPVFTVTSAGPGNFFRLERGWDWVIVNVGPYEARISGDDPVSVSQHGTELKIRFTSDTSVTNDGFRLEVSVHEGAGQA